MSRYIDMTGVGNNSAANECLTNVIIVYTKQIVFKIKIKVRPMSFQIKDSYK